MHHSVIPIIIGALGTVSKHLGMWISKLGTTGIIALLQKACMLVTAKIFKGLCHGSPVHFVLFCELLALNRYGT